MPTSDERDSSYEDDGSPEIPGRSTSTGTSGPTGRAGPDDPGGAAGPAGSTRPAAPDGPGVPGGSGRAHRGNRNLIGIGILVLALVAGGAIWWSPGDGGQTAGPGSGTGEPAQPAEERRAFEQAVDDLAIARGVRYSDSPNFASLEREITVTDFGHQFGTMSYPEQTGLDELDQDVLRIGDEIFTKDHLDPTADPDDPEPGPWTTNPLTGNETLRESLEQFHSPRLLAARLESALAEVPELPTPDDPDLPELEVDGVPALRADTSAGTLLVAAEPPYRVLRLQPYDVRRFTEEMRDFDAEDAEGAEDVPRPSEQDWGDSEGMDVEVLTGDDVGEMFDQLATYVDQLDKSVDRGIDFTMEASGELDCDASGCTVTQRVTGEVRPKAQERLTGGKVDARLTADITIDGQEAGHCEDTKSFRLSGNELSGTLRCVAGEAGPVFTRVDQEYRQRARSRGGGRYSFPSRADTWVEARAVTTAELKKLRKLVELAREFEGCSEASGANSFVRGTRVLLADGTTRPIERVTPGTEVLSTDPVTGITRSEPVTATVTGSGPKDLTHLTVAGGEDGERTADPVTGTLTATDGHPFWEPTRRSWTPAADLETGDRLATASEAAARPGEDSAGEALPGEVRVAASREERRSTTVHNLTVAHTHTYYVLAGDTPILVHNQHEKGERGKESLIEVLRSRGYDILEHRGKPVEISVRASNGVKVRFDVVAKKDGRLFYFDAKNGPGAGFTRNQGRLGGYAAIETGGGEYYGGNAKKVGLSGKFGPSPVFVAGFGGYPFC